MRTVIPVDEAEENSHSEEELHIRNRSQHQGVVLEEIELTQDGSAAVGTILVLNECYEKEVAVRHSANEWKIFDDTSAEWLETVEEGQSTDSSSTLIFPRDNFHLNLLSHSTKNDNHCNILLHIQCFKWGCYWCTYSFWCHWK